MQNTRGNLEMLISFFAIVELICILFFRSSWSEGLNTGVEEKVSTNGGQRREGWRITGNRGV